jgi:hypothetical protein
MKTAYIWFRLGSIVVSCEHISKCLGFINDGDADYSN